LLTLGENLADNGGTTASLTAFRKLGKQEQVLPGLENMSPEALFFINLGRVWCGKEREELALQSVNLQ
jgi:predicted metalloendopeptidase